MTKRQAGRRSNSEGTVGQRKDGLWEARITLPGGRRRSLYAKTKAEALKKMEEAKGKIAGGLRLGPERLTVQIWLEQGYGIPWPTAKGLELLSDTKSCAAFISSLR